MKKKLGKVSWVVRKEEHSGEGVDVCWLRSEQGGEVCPGTCSLAWNRLKDEHVCEIVIVSKLVL